MSNDELKQLITAFDTTPTSAQLNEQIARQQDKKLRNGQSMLDLQRSITKFSRNKNDKLSINPTFEELEEIPEIIDYTDFT